MTGLGRYWYQHETSGVNQRQASPKPFDFGGQRLPVTRER
jgi:hypothetical protein